MPVVIILFFGGAWFGLFKPEFEMIAKYKLQPAAARTQIEKMIQQLSTYNPPDDKERAEWKSMEGKVDRKIPRGRQITELYSLISSLAEKYELVDLQRQEVALSDSAYSTAGIARNGYDIELIFQGNYASVVKFLNDLQNAERLVEIVSIELNRSLPLLQVKMVLRSFYIPEK